MSFEIYYWDLLKNKELQSLKKFPDIISACKLVISNMWFINAKIPSLFNVLKKIPPFQEFILAYYWRNISYLASSYSLIIKNLCGPSRDLQRTVLDTIARGYLFIFDNELADKNYLLLHNGIITSEDILELKKMLDKDFVNKDYQKIIMSLMKDRELSDEDKKYIKNDIKKYWEYFNVIRVIYTRSREKYYRGLYRDLSKDSHPSLRGIYLDLDYSNEQIESSLNSVLILSYSNIELLLEAFNNEFISVKDPLIKNMIIDTMTVICSILGYSPEMSPNKRKWQNKIMFNKGNFIKILGS